MDTPTPPASPVFDEVARRFPKLTFTQSLRTYWREAVASSVEELDKAFFKVCVPYLKVVMARIQQAQEADEQFDPGTWKNLACLQDLPKSVSAQSYYISQFPTITLGYYELHIISG